MHVCAQYMLCALLGNMTRELLKTLHAEGGKRQELKVLTQPHCCALLVLHITCTSRFVTMASVTKLCTQLGY